MSNPPPNGTTRHPGRSLSILGVGLGLLVCMVATQGARADTYHVQSIKNQPCSDCHTLHYGIDQGVPVGTDLGGPFAQLLVRSTTNRLCLYCHDGSDTRAPDVFIPVTAYGSTGDEHSAAGFFGAPVGSTNLNGHDLGVFYPSVPFSTMVNVTLTCASCHDPHGTDGLRDIVLSPDGLNQVPVGLGVDVFAELSPGDPPSMPATVEAYRESNEGYRSSTSLWCTTCHNELQPLINNVGNRTHHFIDVPINGIGYPTDPAHWATGIGTGFGVATSDGIEGVPRLRFQVPAATDFISSQIASPDNEVMCGTCHLAHGSAYRSGLVWPNKDSGSDADRNSGCQQCHNF